MSPVLVNNLFVSLPHLIGLANAIVIVSARETLPIK